MVDCRRRRLVYPVEWLLDPTCWKDNDISLDYVGSEMIVPDLKTIKDIQQRDRLMEQEDRRRRDGRTSVIRNRIAELEKLELTPAKKTVTFASQVTILARPLLEPTGPTIPQDEGICKMERALGTRLPLPPPPPDTAITADRFRPG